MNTWMTSQNRKVHQRKVNRFVRQINKNVYNDDLWRGRFVMYQVGSPWFFRYEDKSGAELANVQLEVKDLMTGKTYRKSDEANIWCSHNGARIWRLMNDAIVNEFDVWRVDDDPRDHKNDPAYDFRKKGNKNGR